ncbi:MAG: hypothetical protein R3Y47_08780 [Lachnospiraceae bacterium]
MKNLVEKLVRKCMNGVADRGDKAIVVEVGLAVIAVALLVVFKSSIQGIMNTVIGTMGTTIENLFINS